MLLHQSGPHSHCQAQYCQALVSVSDGLVVGLDLIGP